VASTGAVGEDVVDLMDQPHPRGSLVSQQLRQVPPGMQKGLVHDILGGAAVAGEPLGVGEQQRRVLRVPRPHDGLRGRPGRASPTPVAVRRPVRPAVCGDIHNY
jgi:hypothetical protein